MRQKATVIETRGDIAVVRVLRSSMCEGCANRADGKACACSALLGGAKEMKVEAQNCLAAHPGDDVEIETESSAVLGYAALVFLLPVVGALAFYLIAAELSVQSHVPWIAALIGFVLAFLPALFLDRIHRNNAPRIRIVSVICHGEVKDDEEDEDDEDDDDIEEME